MINNNPHSLAIEIGIEFRTLNHILECGEVVDLTVIEKLAGDLDQLKILNTSGFPKLDNRVLSHMEIELADLASRCTEVSQPKLISEKKPSSPEKTSTSVKTSLSEKPPIPEKPSKPKFKEDLRIVKPLTSIEKLAMDYEPDSDNRNGLEQLDSTHRYIPIIGDGHCMYRSIITGMLLQLAKLPASTREAFENGLIQKIEGIGGSTELFSGFQTLTQAIERLSQPKPPNMEDIIGDRKISDDLVKFCRHLAADWNNTFGNDVFVNEACLYSGSKKQYLAEQVDMNFGEMGGNPELIALSKIFDMDLVVLNVTSIGKAEHKAAQRQHFENPNSLFEIDLLFRPGHYDLAVRKS